MSLFVLSLEEAVPDGEELSFVQRAVSVSVGSGEELLGLFRAHLVPRQQLGYFRLTQRPRAIPVQLLKLCTQLILTVKERKLLF